MRIMVAELHPRWVFWVLWLPMLERAETLEARPFLH